MNLRARALDVLRIPDPAAKAAAARDLGARADGGDSDSGNGNLGTGTIDPEWTVPEPPGLPGRPARPRLVEPKQVPMRSPHTPAGRAALLHAIAHIEFNAINLALDAVWRFPGLPAAYYRDWLTVAAEEALHFGLLRDHLLCSLGHDYGDFDAHDGLWSMAEKTRSDVLARMALVPRTLEARGLDATPPLQAKFAAAGDLRAVEILGIILRDEVGHVAVGNRWYRWLCERAGVDPEREHPRLAAVCGAPRPRPPFNLEARRAAGFSAAELEQLSSAWAAAAATATTAKAAPQDGG